MCYSNGTCEYRSTSSPLPLSLSLHLESTNYLVGSSTFFIDMLELSRSLTLFSMCCMSARLPRRCLPSLPFRFDAAVVPDAAVAAGSWFVLSWCINDSESSLWSTEPRRDSVVNSMAWFEEYRPQSRSFHAERRRSKYFSDSRTRLENNSANSTKAGQNRCVRGRVHTPAISRGRSARAREVSPPGRQTKTGLLDTARQRSEKPRAD